MQQPQPPLGLQLGKVRLPNGTVETYIIRVLRVNADESWLGDMYITNSAGFAQKIYAYRKRYSELWEVGDVFGLI